MRFFKKGEKEDPGNYRSISLTLASGKVMEQITLSVMYMRTTRKLHLTSAGSWKAVLLDKPDLLWLVSYLVDEEMAVDMIYLDAVKTSTLSLTAVSWRSWQLMT